MKVKKNKKKATTLRHEVLVDINTSFEMHFVHAVMLSGYMIARLILLLNNF